MSGRSPEPGRGPALPPLRWLSAADVAAAMPPIEERLRLAERTLTALATPGASELPSKIGIHPRPEGSFVHAMPAFLRGEGPTDDLIGMKWVAGFSTNNERGIQAINAVVIVNDASTGLPTAMLDGAPITALRTAAVSGVALRQFAGSDGTRGKSPVVTIVGAGIQCRAHIDVVGHVLAGSRLRIVDRHPARAEALRDVARNTPGIDAAEVAPSVREAAATSDVVITAASFAPPSERQVMTNAWLRPDATVVAVDYATFVAAEVARDAALFLVDHREQFLANREAGNFDAYPDPTATIGEAILSGTPRPEGRVVVTHLGVGLADVIFADAIVRAAATLDLGNTLPR